MLHDQCRERGISSASLWAAIPHYVAAVPNPKAALALVRRLEAVTGIALEASELEDAMERFEGQIDRAVAANPEIQELVQRLESEQADELELPQDMPSGDTLARDFQRFCASAATARTRARTSGASSRLRWRGSGRDWPCCLDRIAYARSLCRHSCLWLNQSRKTPIGFIRRSTGAI